MMGTRKCTLGGLKLGLTAVGLLAGLGRPAMATPIPGYSNLDQLINPSPATVTLGNYQFSSFTYDGIPPDGPNPAPTAANVSVDAPDSPSIGLNFSAPWASVGGFNQESVITYKVHALNNTPFQFIFGVGVQFNGAAPVPGSGTYAKEIDTLTDSAGNPIANLPPIELYDDGSAASIDSAMSAPIDPSLQDIIVHKDILVVSGADGASTISVSNNTFITPVGNSPEPASLGVFALASAGLLGRRRRA
jgi:hypothetical protein